MSEVEDRHQSTDDFYALLDELAQRTGPPRTLASASGRSGWPSHGVYFFFEPGELRSDGSMRVTRVGTHALTATSRTRLWTRLSQHRGHGAGSNPGGGNHRGSVFRLHVGSALIRRGGYPDHAMEVWLSPSPEPSWRDVEAEIERAVSFHIRSMPVLALSVPTMASGGSDRGFIERNAIALLSQASGGVERSSSQWLGLDAVRLAVRTSGLWNVNHVEQTPEPCFLARMSAHVRG